MKLSLVNLAPIKEDLSRASMEELEALARQAQDIQDSEAGYAQQQGDFDIDKFGNEFADQKVMPYGGEYYSMNDIQDAIATRLDKSGDVPYDVAIGRMTQDEYDEYMSTVKPDRDSFEKSSKFDRIKEEEYTLDFGELDEVLKEQGKSDTEIKEIKSKLLKLSESNKVKAQELTEKLCKKGEAYRKRRMAAGEKSSAYLSGRAVKVCKGQISGRKKKK